MVGARGRGLASGAYNRISVAVAEAVSSIRPSLLVDVGVARATTLVASRQRPSWAWTSARLRWRRLPVHTRRGHTPSQHHALPLHERSVNPAWSFLARLCSGTSSSGASGRRRRDCLSCPSHLALSAALVYGRPRPHEVKPPLRSPEEWFDEIGSVTLRFTLVAQMSLLCETSSQ